MTHLIAIILEKVQWAKMFDKRFLILLTGKSSTKVRYHEPLEFCLQIKLEDNEANHSLHASIGFSFTLSCFPKFSWRCPSEFICVYFPFDGSIPLFNFPFHYPGLGMSFTDIQINLINCKNKTMLTIKISNNKSKFSDNGNANDNNYN